VNHGIFKKAAQLSLKSTRRYICACLN